MAGVMSLILVANFVINVYDSETGNMCMYVCMYTHICTRIRLWHLFSWRILSFASTNMAFILITNFVINVYEYETGNIYVFVCLYAYTHMCVCLCMHVCTSIRTVCWCVLVCVRVCAGHPGSTRISTLNPKHLTLNPTTP